jgi:N-acetyl-gamma-glutamyl-phosphate reductase
MNKFDKKIGVVILGGGGYGAGELLRLLLQHPTAEVVSVTSSSTVGAPIQSVHTSLAGFYDKLCFEATPDWNRFIQYPSRVIFSSLPTGTSAVEICNLVNNGLSPNTVVIDLSGDFRLQSEDTHQKHYAEVPFSAEIRKQFSFGLPELFRDKIKAATLITNPGCLAATCILAAAPLVQAGLVDDLFFDGKTGTSGAGRSPSGAMHHPKRNENLEAYKVLSHRHEPEIAQALTYAFNHPLQTSFVPHLIPVTRGILVSTYGKLKSASTTETIRSLYEKFYSSSPFIRLRDASPTLHDVVGTNFCDINITVREDRIVILAALDNLGKGMASNAIQNMNIRFGLEETTGLMFPSLGLI